MFPPRRRSWKAPSSLAPTRLYVGAFGAVPNSAVRHGQSRELYMTDMFERVHAGRLGAGCGLDCGGASGCGLVSTPRI